MDLGREPIIRTDKKKVRKKMASNSRPHWCCRLTNSACPSWHHDVTEPPQNHPNHNKPDMRTGAHAQWTARAPLVLTPPSSSLESKTPVIKQSRERTPPPPERVPTTTSLATQRSIQGTLHECAAGVGDSARGLSVVKQASRPHTLLAS